MYESDALQATHTEPRKINSRPMQTKVGAKANASGTSQKRSLDIDSQPPLKYLKHSENHSRIKKCPHSTIIALRPHANRKDLSEKPYAPYLLTAGSDCNAPADPRTAAKERHVGLTCPERRFNTWHDYTAWHPINIDAFLEDFKARLASLQGYQKT